MINTPSHQTKLKHITDQIKSDNAATEPLVFEKLNVEHLVPHKRQQTEGSRVSTSRLDEVIHIDTEHRLATVESGVTFDELVKQTLAVGFMPMVVPELKGITVGGAISGCSVESLSHRYGGFHDTCTEYEIITGAGEAMICGPQTHPEIFHMIHGSFGTLGRLTAVTCRLIPARRFVKMTYRTYTTIDDYCHALQAACDDPTSEFVDGIIHGPKQFVLCLGHFTDTAPYTSKYDGEGIFYRSTADRTEDYLETYDYFFRYDRDCHWISRNFGLEQALIRRVAGPWLLGSTNMLKLAKRLKPILHRLRPDVTVDLFFGFSRFKEFYQRYQKAINYYPVWVVPYRIAHLYPWINERYLKGVDDKLFIDFTIYGLRQRGDTDYYAVVDQLMAQVQGVKTLISLNRYSRDEFWSIFNKPNYDRAKTLVDPDNRFGNIYDKTLSHS